MSHEEAPDSPMGPHPADRGPAVLNSLLAPSFPTSASVTPSALFTPKLAVTRRTQQATPSAQCCTTRRHARTPVT